MISHNMTDAIKYGNRLIMLKGGEIVTDVSGDKKSNLTPAELVAIRAKGRLLPFEKRFSGVVSGGLPPKHRSRHNTETSAVLRANGFSTNKKSAMRHP